MPNTPIGYTLTKEDLRRIKDVVRWTETQYRNPEGTEKNTPRIDPPIVQIVRVDDITELTITIRTTTTEGWTFSTVSGVYSAFVETWSGGAWSDLVPCFYLDANGNTPTVDQSYVCKLVGQDDATKYPVFSGADLGQYFIDNVAKDGCSLTVTFTQVSLATALATALAPTEAQITFGG